MPIFIDNDVYLGRGVYSVGNQTYRATDGYDLFIFSTRSGNGDDRLIGGKGDDILYGNNGDDTLIGGWGDDILDGSRGNDTLRGGKGDDILRNSWGDGIMVGGQGDDTLDGGWGAETFVFREGDGHDTITEFGFGWSGSDHRSYKKAKEAKKLAKENGGLDVIELHLKAPAGTTDEAAFEGLTIRGDGKNTVIEYGGSGDTITLVDVRPGSVTIDDFDFVFIG